MFKAVLGKQLNCKKGEIVKHARRSNNLKKVCQMNVDMCCLDFLTTLVLSLASNSVKKECSLYKNSSLKVKCLKPRTSQAMEENSVIHVVSIFPVIHYANHNVETHQCQPTFTFASHQPIVFYTSI